MCSPRDLHFLHVLRAQRIMGSFILITHKSTRSEIPITWLEPRFHMYSLDECCITTVYNMWKQNRKVVSVLFFYSWCFLLFQAAKAVWEQWDDPLEGRAANFPSSTRAWCFGVVQRKIALRNGALPPKSFRLIRNGAIALVKTRVCIAGSLGH